MVLNLNISDYKVNLNLNNDLTLVQGNSGTGKTLIFNHLKNDIKNSDNVFYNSEIAKNISFLDFLINTKGKLIVIDNADIVLSPEDRKTIAFDKYNKYLIFGNNVEGLWITEENLAKLIRDDKTKRIYLDYILKNVNSK